MDYNRYITLTKKNSKQPKTKTRGKNSKTI